MNNPGFPIRVVSERTGLKPDLIRMWERRYQAVLPERTSTGRRLYSEQDILRLRLLKSALECGWRIGDVCARPNEELEDLANHDELSRNIGAGIARKIGLDQSARLDHMDKLLEAIARLNFDLVSSLLESAEQDLGFPEVLDLVVSPLLTEIGLRWERGEFTLSQEHLLSATLRHYLDSVRIRENAGATASTILSTTPAGQNHELGALMTAATGAVSGWNSLYMNPSTPAADIAWLAGTVKARVVALSIVYPARDALLVSELQHLLQLLPGDCFLLIGGSSAEFYQSSMQHTDRCAFLSKQMEVQSFLAHIHDETKSRVIGDSS